MTVTARPHKVSVADTEAPERTQGEFALYKWLRSMPGDASEVAATLVKEQGLPTRRTEAFRYSDLRSALGDAMPVPLGSGPELPAFLEGAYILQADHDRLWGRGTIDGLHVQANMNPGNGASSGIASILAAGLAPIGNDFKILKPLDRPIVVLRGPAAPARLRIEVLENARATLVEISDGEGGFTTNQLDVSIARGGSLHRIILQKGDRGTIDLNHAHITVASGASLTQTSLAFGGKFARVETEIIVEGEGAFVSVNGAYLLAGMAHADATVNVHHTGPGAVTKEIFKGAVKDKAHGVFQGKIKVDRAAQHTDARLRHDALMLSEGASIDAKPELEIWADDVACAHGNTIGAIDENALFYMRQRGIPEAVAKALLVEAFITEAFDNVADDQIRAWLSAQAQGWLATAITGKDNP